VSQWDDHDDRPFFCAQMSTRIALTLPCTPPAIPLQLLACARESMPLRLKLADLWTNVE
jgi:hypothetical protein